MDKEFFEGELTEEVDDDSCEEPDVGFTSLLAGVDDVAVAVDDVAMLLIVSTLLLSLTLLTTRPNPFLFNNSDCLLLVALPIVLRA